MTAKRKLLEADDLLRRYAAGERDFSNIRLFTMVMQKVELPGINLSNAEFLGIDLKGINLSNANLTGARLLSVNLTDAILSHANLENADLSGALCINTDLTYANLDRTTLTMATFERANFWASEMDEAIVIGTNFKGAINFHGPGEGSFMDRTILLMDTLLSPPIGLNKFLG